MEPFLQVVLSTYPDHQKTAYHDWHHANVNATSRQKEPETRTGVTFSNFSDFQHQQTTPSEADKRRG